MMLLLLILSLHDPIFSFFFDVVSHPPHPPTHQPVLLFRGALPGLLSFARSLALVIPAATSGAQRKDILLEVAAQGKQAVPATS